MADYYKLLQVPRGTKARLETIKLNLLVNTIVYATDTKELGIKLSDGNIEYFMNATAINASKQDKLTAGDNITIDENTNVISASGNASDIVEDASHRFVTDTEKNTWNAKQNALGFTPENVANKVDNLNSPNNTTFGTTLAVKNYVDTVVGDVAGLEKHDIVLIPDTEFTITQAHFNKTLIITSSSDVTITVPTKVVENIEKGFFCDIVRYGTGEVSFSGAGIVLNSAGSLSIDAQYIAASLIKIDNNNEWLLIGGRE